MGKIGRRRMIKSVKGAQEKERKTAREMQIKTLSLTIFTFSSILPHLWLRTLNESISESVSIKLFSISMPQWYLVNEYI